MTKEHAAAIKVAIHHIYTSLINEDGPTDDFDHNDLGQITISMIHIAASVGWKKFTAEDVPMSVRGERMLEASREIRRLLIDLAGVPPFEFSQDGALVTSESVDVLNDEIIDL